MLDFESTKFSAPVPGMSLTTEPKGRAWEKPAKYADPEDALSFYVDSLILGGVMKGIHSIDVGVIISPALLIFVSGIGRIMDIDIITGIEESDVPDEGMLRMAAKQEVEKDVEGQEELAQIVDEAMQDMQGGIMSKPLNEGEV